MAKLKAALANQQYSAAKAAAKKRSLQNEESKKQSIKDSLSGSKKGLKKQKQKLKLKEKLLEDKVKSESIIDKEEVESSSSKIVKPKNPNQKPVIPFTKEDTILLLGEGNFSFTLSLLYPPHSLNGNQILATAYDSEEITCKKYPDSIEIIKELKENGVKIEFGVDAGNLDKSKLVSEGKGKGKERRRWSRVVFNFPHVGAGITDQDRNILTNQHMLLRFFLSVEPYLTDGPAETQIKKGKQKSKPSSDNEDEDDELDNLEEEDSSPYINEEGLSSTIPQPYPSQLREMKIPNKQGSILITLLTCSPYSLWALSKLATKPPHLCPGTKEIQPRYGLKRSFVFNPDVYEKYEHRRTIGWKVGLSKGGNEEIKRKGGGARTWEFVRKEKRDD